MTMTLEFFDMTSLSVFFDSVFLLLSSLVTGLSLILISSLVLVLRQFYFIRDWPEIQKWEIAPYGFCPIYGDWGKLWIPNMAWTSVIECYCGPKLENWQWRYNFFRWHHRQFFFYFVLFLLSSLATGPSFMSILSLVLELW